MVDLSQLWLPILLSAVFVFLASSVIHMLLPLHKGDLGKLPGEGEVLAAMRAQGVSPGDYMFPCPDSMKDMGSAEMKAKYAQGPVGFLVVLPPGGAGVGKSLVQWFLYTLLVGFCLAYLGSLVLPAGLGYPKVFRFIGSAAILVYAVAVIPDSIWKGHSWKNTCKFVFDGVVYGLVTAGTFGWLWPQAL